MISGMIATRKEWGGAIRYYILETAGFARISLVEAREPRVFPRDTADVQLVTTLLDKPLEDQERWNAHDAEKRRFCRLNAHSIVGPLRYIRCRRLHSGRDNHRRV